ncbi:unnamed protein product, partial [Prorocentrum cordatum]
VCLRGDVGHVEREGVCASRHQLQIADVVLAARPLPAEEDQRGNEPAGREPGGEQRGGGEERRVQGRRAGRALRGRAHRGARLRLLRGGRRRGHAGRPGGHPAHFAEWFKGPSVTREYDENTDRGIGVTFWDGRNDPGKCMDRLKQVLAKFEQMHGVDPDLTAGQPICDFDGWYSGEFDGVWPRNHTGAVEPSRGFAWADGWAGEGGEEYGSELASEEDEEEEPAATAIEPASEEQGDYYAYVGADSGIAS